MHGKPVDVSTVGKAIGHGIAYVTEDRKGLGLVLDEDIRKNVSLANLEAVSSSMVIDDGARVQGGERLPQGTQHPLLGRRAAGGQPVGRQPAEGGAQQVALHQSPNC
jgi:ABC-type uncharacterized transport system ATPase subunit